MSDICYLPCMQIPMVTADELKSLLPYNTLIEELKSAFKKDSIEVPPRQHYQYASGTSNDNTLLLMPSWQSGRNLGIKLVTVTPDNNQRHMPSVQALMILFDTSDGAPLMIIDGTELTIRRTVAASALASSFLSREESSRLLIVGTGQIAAQLAAAHSAVRDLQQIWIWGRHQHKAERLSAGLQTNGFPAEPVADLHEYIQQAHIISCATMSTEPLIQGSWLQQGQHLDLIGSFQPHMREVDTEAIKRSSCYVDIMGALEEAGEFQIPISQGEISTDHVLGDLGALCRREESSRTDFTQITCFKSVGYALEDLVAANLVYDNFRYHES